MALSFRLCLGRGGEKRVREGGTGLAPGAARLPSHPRSRLAAGLRARARGSLTRSCSTSS